MRGVRNTSTPEALYHAIREHYAAPGTGRSRVGESLPNKAGLEIRKDLYARAEISSRSKSPKADDR